MHCAGKAYTSAVVAGEGCNYVRNGVCWNTNVHCPWFELRLGESEMLATSEIVPCVFYLWRQSADDTPPSPPTTSCSSLSFHLEEESSLASSVLSSLKLAAVSLDGLRLHGSLFFMFDFTLRHSALIYRFSFLFLFAQVYYSFSPF